MIVTENQRRWWFATHPEYSSSRPGHDAADGNRFKRHAILPDQNPLTVQAWCRKARAMRYQLSGTSPEDIGDYNSGYYTARKLILDKQELPRCDLDDNSAFALGFGQGVLQAYNEKEASLKLWEAAQKTWETVTEWLSLLWTVGEDPLSLTSKGKVPAWSTQATRYWKNEAATEGAIEKWSAENIKRMKRGLAPQRFNRVTGLWESKELHHTPIPRRHGGNKFIEVWPDEHAAIDFYRRLKKR